MAMRTGFSVPVGEATAGPGDDLRARYSTQVPFVIDLGAKFTRAIYVGVYLGFGIGSEGSNARVEALCDDDSSNLQNDIQCSAYTLRLGLEGRYYLSPGDSLDPWLGYGIGFEAAVQELNDRSRRRSEQTTASGLEFARLGAGFDWRASTVFGIGPLVEFAVGRYTHSKTEVDGVTTFDGSIEEGGTHAWVTLGFRGVFFP
jgi:hypothetical protein